MRLTPPRLLFAAAFAMLALAAPPASALPSFAQQTGMACNACHVGAFGPQLTPFGRQFKLNGYADGAASSLPPVAAMAIASFTHTAKTPEDAPASGFSRNNNVALDEAGIFYAGRIFDRIGAFAQATWDGIAHKWSMDNTDIRYGDTADIAGHSVTYGVTLNNNPTLQDPYNTLPAWSFPFTASPLAPEVPGSTLIEGGLEHQVAGFGAYALIDDLLYAEASGYHALGEKVVDKLGIGAEGAKLAGTRPYLRVALQKSFDGQFAEIGAFGFFARTLPSRLVADGRDKVRDWGIDASYQFLNSDRHIVTANASWIHEKRWQDASQALGLTEFDRGTASSLRGNLTYTLDNTYGLTAGLFATRGSTDPLLNPDSVAGKPNSRGWIAQADFTPFGKDGAPWSPYLNVRFGLQYTGYWRYNGAATNYDGNGHNAKDNNTLMFFTWLAF